MGAPGEERELRIRRAGDRGLLVELPPTISAGKLQAAARAVALLAGVVRCTPGHSSLLVVAEGAVPVTEIEAAISGAETREFSGVLHELRVDFSEVAGPDLQRLLDHAEIGRAAFLERIASLTFVARFLGFRPGFAYLDGVPRDWQLPRLDKTRPAVPPGSFAVAGGMAGFYPAPSPGGWNLLGRTDAVLWEPRRAQPNLISPGDRIRVVPV